MSGQRFAKTGVLAVALAAFLMVEAAWALPFPPPPPAFRAPGPVGPPLMAWPAHYPGGHFARSTFIPYGRWRYQPYYYNYYPYYTYYCPNYGSYPQVYPYIPAGSPINMDTARLAFQKGDYAEAEKQCEQGINLRLGDANPHELRALCQFAQGKYQNAAATLYEVLAAGPGAGWDTLSSFYTSAQTYAAQLRALERYVEEYPKDAAGRFVLAYHYRALDQREAAAGQLREVIKLQPKDRVSPGILEALEKAKQGK